MPRIVPSTTRIGWLLPEIERLPLKVTRTSLVTLELGDCTNRPAALPCRALPILVALPAVRSFAVTVVVE